MDEIDKTKEAEAEKEYMDQIERAMARVKIELAARSSADVSPVPAVPEPSSTTQSTASSHESRADEASKCGESYAATKARVKTPLHFGTARALNFETFVSERKRHETKEAASAITYRYTNALAQGTIEAFQAAHDGDSARGTEHSEDSTKLKAALVAEITRVMSASILAGRGDISDGRAEASGVERGVRWKGKEGIVGKPGNESGYKQNGKLNGRLSRVAGLRVILIIMQGLPQLESASSQALTPQRPSRSSLLGSPTGTR